MLPAVGLAIEALGAEALAPGLMDLAELATSAEDGDIHVTLQSSWLESFDYTLMTGELTVNLQNGSSYTYPGTSIATAIGFAKAASPGSYYDENIKLGGSKGHAAPVISTELMFRIHGV